MIGGGGEQKTLRLVAQYADATNVFGDRPRIAHKYAVLREHCERSAATTTRSSDRTLQTSIQPRRRRPAAGEPPAQIVDRFGELGRRRRPARHLQRPRRRRPDAARADRARRHPPGPCLPAICELGASRIPPGSIVRWYDCTAMTDDTTKTDRRERRGQRRAGRAGRPFGGLAIDFSADTGAVPLAAAVSPIAFEPAAAQRRARRRQPGGGAAGEGRTESKVVIVGSGPAGLTAAIYAARANLEPIVLAGSAAGRPADDHQRRRELPGLPGRHPGPGPDGPLPRPGRAVRDAHRRRRRRPGRLLRAAVPALGARRRVPRPSRSSSRPARRAIWLGLDSETRLRGRGVSACATCDGFFFRDKEIAVVGGGDTALEEATFLTRFASRGPPAPPARRVPGQQDHASTGRSTNPKIEIHSNTAVDEVLGDDAGRGRCACATR